MTENNSASATPSNDEADEEKKKREPVYRLSDDTKGEANTRWVESKNGGSGFAVDDDPNHVQVNEETGVVTIYPDGIDKDPNNTYSLTSTAEGTESDYSTVTPGKIAGGGLQYGDTWAFTTNVNKQGEFSVEIIDRDLYEQSYDEGLREVFKNPQGDILTLNRDGELVEASADAKMLFGKTGQEREDIRQALKSADYDVNISAENMPQDTKHTDEIQLASGAGANAQEQDGLPSR